MLHTLTGGLLLSVWTSMATAAERSADAPTSAAESAATLTPAPSAEAPSARVRRHTVGTPWHRYPLRQPVPEATTDDQRPFTVEHHPNGDLTLSLELSADEAIWGFGQRLDAFNLRGTRLETWATDGWNRLDTSYFAVPFFISSHGYALFVNHPGRIQFDIGATVANRLSIRVPDAAVELIAFEGAPAEIVQAYTELVGRPKSAPPWIYRPWMSRNSYFGSAEIDRMLQRMAALGMPIGVVVLEAWAEELHNFAFERRRYPLPITWIRDLKQRGVRVICWITPSVWPESMAHQAARDNGWLVRNEDGSEHIVRWLENGRKIDFRISAAQRAWRDWQVPLVEMGVSGFKTDGGEHMPDPIFHNQHPYYYTRASLDAFASAGREGITFNRSANPLSAGLSLFWAGDQYADWSRLAAVVRGGLSAAVSGFPLWGHDIGGYSGIPDKNLYLRWLQFGVFSPLMHFHGETAREPWHYDEETIRIAQFYFRIRARLEPQLHQWGLDAIHKGIPILRPLPWHYPGDPHTHSIDDQYLLGPDLLVAPMVHAGESRSVYLPDGDWIDLWNHSLHSGPRQVPVSPALHEIPLFVRASAYDLYAGLVEGYRTTPPSPLEIEWVGSKNERGVARTAYYLRPGQEQATFRFRLTQRTDAPMPIGIRLAAPAGIHVSPRQIVRFMLEPNQTREIEFDLHIPAAHPVGTYPMRLEVRGEEQDWPFPDLALVRPPAWWVAGPFPGGIGSAHPFDPAEISSDRSLQDAEGNTIDWQRVPADAWRDDGWIDLSAVAGDAGFQTSFLHTTLASVAPRRIHVWAGSGDGITIWLNGRELFHHPIHRNPDSGLDRVTGVLNRGANDLVIRLQRDLAPHHLFIRFD